MDHLSALGEMIKSINSNSIKNEPRIINGNHSSMNNRFTPDGFCNDSYYNNSYHDHHPHQLHHNHHHRHHSDNQQIMTNEDCQKKGIRNMFSVEQIKILEDEFHVTHYPDSATREKLSKILNINASKIQVWFQNRRAKFRKFDLKGKRSHYKKNQLVNEKSFRFNGTSYSPSTNSKLNQFMTNMQHNSCLPQLQTSTSSTSSSSSSSTSSASSSSSSCCSDLLLATNQYYLKSVVPSAASVLSIDHPHNPQICYSNAYTTNTYSIPEEFNIPHPHERFQQIYAPGPPYQYYGQY